MTLAAAFIAGCQPTADATDTDVSVNVRNESDRVYLVLFLESSGAPMPFHRAVDVAARNFGVALEDHGPWHGSVAFAGADCTVIGRFQVDRTTTFVISPAGQIGTTDHLSDADLTTEDNIYPDSERCPAVP